MRWVDVKVGIKQRIGAILGNSTEETNNGALTYWSIQASMLENLKRVVKSLVGDSSSGRPMKGMWLTANGSDYISISSGTSCAALGISLTASLYLCLSSA